MNHNMKTFLTKSFRTKVDIFENTFTMLNVKRNSVGWIEILLQVYCDIRRACFKVYRNFYYNVVQFPDLKPLPKRVHIFGNQSYLKGTMESELSIIISSVYFSLFFFWLTIYALLILK